MCVDTEQSIIHRLVDTVNAPSISSCVGNKKIRSIHLDTFSSRDEFLRIRRKHASEKKPGHEFSIEERIIITITRDNQKGTKI